jgi:hypothetical protein
MRRFAFSAVSAPERVAAAAHCTAVPGPERTAPFLRTAGGPTKPAQALAMIGRAVAAAVPFAWLTADETAQ